MSSHELEFEGKVVVITGGGGGIGKAAAARFLEEGASVVLSSRRQEVLDAARAGARPVRASAIELFAGDVELAGGRRGARRRGASTRFGRVDVLVNSTGIFRVVPFLEQTEEQVEEALDSILRPTFYGSQAAARAMVGRATAARSSTSARCGRSTRSRRRRRAPTRPPRRAGTR